jgi:hypothetical protein
LSTKIDLLINTAKAFCLDVPLLLLGRVDEVIELAADVAYWPFSDIL